ncbi:uncharacterized protein K452DRAFT_42845 [Aplosporella prunicola CBS 121167]|uniref:Uncharacterized protein n=1 Tax=Aplosporella prunicola CBS 121167 TaxID=1176127 RepID=A0A6A6B9N6_9PEZI|nr:uncharacterized protein K452DRAFT_42845 [Aplosporella prunicola CBS 121167]KAF2140919.1 hypothetical protein K452DRAFT_42845 [Aplosporella prunicola CBS 121167]
MVVEILLDTYFVQALRAYNPYHLRTTWNAGPSQMRLREAPRLTCACLSAATCTYGDMHLRCTSDIAILLKLVLSQSDHRHELDHVAEEPVARVMDLCSEHCFLRRRARVGVCACAGGLTGVHLHAPTLGRGFPLLLALRAFLAGAGWPVGTN